MAFNSIKVVKGNGGFGGPSPQLKKNINLSTLLVAVRNPRLLIKLLN